MCVGFFSEVATAVEWSLEQRKGDLDLVLILAQTCQVVFILPAAVPKLYLPSFTLSEASAV